MDNPSRKRPRQPDAQRIILTMDLDCFYASVALRTRPHLVDRPVAITQKHLCVTTNYVARQPKYGAIQKMTPVSRALKACPELILIDGSDLAPFRAANAQVIDIIRTWLADRIRRVVDQLGGQSFSCPCQKLGLDEVFLDLTELIQCEKRLGGQPWRFEGHVFGTASDDDSHRAFMIASQLAAELRQRITKETKLTLCGGISETKLLAKLAVNMNKPNAQTIFLPDCATQYVATIHPRKLLGFGHSIEQKINAWAEQNSLSPCSVVGDILSWFGRGHKGLKDLSRILDSETDAKHILSICRGEDYNAVVDAGDAPKSMASIESCRNCSTMKEVRQRLNAQSADLVQRLREDRLHYSRRPRTLTVSYRFRGKGYAGLSRSIPMPVEVSALGDSISGTEDLERARNAMVQASLGVLKEHAGVYESAKFDLTLLAVGASNFSDNRNALPAPRAERITSFFSNGENGVIMNASSSPKAKQEVDISKASVERSSSHSICPICNRGLPKGLVQMNAHVESCLRSSESDALKGKITKSRTRRVDSFFRKR